MLEASKLSFGTAQVQIFRDLSFSLSQGERLFLQGANGSGKSTLLRMILGHTKPLSGQISLSVPLSRVGYLPQLHNTEFHIPVTLGDVLNFSCRGLLPLDQVEDLGLLSRKELSKEWNTSSGGERQRTLLTSIFIQDHSLLLLDEPMNHLDLDSKRLVKSLILSFPDKNKGRSLIFVSHDPMDDDRLSSCDSKVILLNPRQLGEYG